MIAEILALTMATAIPSSKEFILLKNGQSAVLSEIPKIDLDFSFNDNTLTSFRDNKKTDSKIQLSPQATKALQLLDSWKKEDKKEQKETWEYLTRVLDEDRLSSRKLFS